MLKDPQEDDYVVGLRRQIDGGDRPGFEADVLHTPLTGDQIGGVYALLA